MKIFQQLFPNKTADCQTISIVLPYQDTTIPTACDIRVTSAYIPKIRGCLVYINRVFLT